MRTVIVAAPSLEPITLEEAKAQLRIEADFSLDNDYIESLISAARGRCESYCNQFFTAQDIKLVFDGDFPSSLALPYTGLTVTSITYTDSSYASATLSTDDYTVDAVNQVIYFDTAISAINYQVLATTSAPADIAGVKHAIKMIVTDLYELRAETAVGVSLTENPAVKALLYPYRQGLGV